MLWRPFELRCVVSVKLREVAFVLVVVAQKELVAFVFFQKRSITRNIGWHESDRLKTS